MVKNGEGGLVEGGVSSFCFPFCSGDGVRRGRGPSNKEEYHGVFGTGASSGDLDLDSGSGVKNLDSSWDSQTGRSSSFVELGGFGVVADEGGVSSKYLDSTSPR